MKKYLLIIFLILTLLVSCTPEKPQDVQAYCRDLYLYDEDYSDYPPAFIGACVSSFQTGKPNAFVSLCGSELFWASINPSPTSKSECIQAIHSLEIP